MRFLLTNCVARSLTSLKLHCIRSVAILDMQCFLFVKLLIRSFFCVLLLLPFISRGQEKLTSSPVDSSVEMTRSISLAEFLQEAEEKSNQLEIAKLNLRKMINNVDRVLYRYLPRVQFLLDGPKYITVNQEGRSPESFEDVQYNGSLDYRQSLPFNIDTSARYTKSINNLARATERLNFEIGKDLLRKDPIQRDLTLTRQRRLLSEISYQQTVLNFRHESRLAYYRLLEAKLLYENEEERFKTDELFQKENEQKFSAGIISEFQLIDFQREFKQSLRRRASAKNNYLNAISEIAFILQLEDMPDWEYQNVDLEIDGLRIPSPGKLIEAAIARNFDLANLRNALFSNEVNLQFLENQRLPELRLYANATFDYSDNNFNTNRVESEAYEFGLRLNVPLFGDRFIQHSDILELRYDQEISELNLDQRLLFFKNEIRKDLLSLSQLIYNYTVTKDITVLLERDFILSKERLNLGDIDSFSLLRVKNQYFNALNDHERAKFAILRQLSQMERDYPQE